jgi:hypothetical protein
VISLQTNCISPTLLNAAVQLQRFCYYCCYSTVGRGSTAFLTATAAAAAATAGAAADDVYTLLISTAAVRYVLIK